MSNWTRPKIASDCSVALLALGIDIHSGGSIALDTDACCNLRAGWFLLVREIRTIGNSLIDQFRLSLIERRQRRSRPVAETSTPSIQRPLVMAHRHKSWPDSDNAHVGRVEPRCQSHQIRARF